MLEYAQMKFEDFDKFHISYFGILDTNGFEYDYDKQLYGKVHITSYLLLMSQK